MKMISLIVTTYNQSEMLNAVLSSLSQQTVKNFEVIVIDDCSTDNTLKLIKQFHIRTFKLEKNCGQADARNIGASKAKADILVFLDSDIILKNDALEKIAEHIEKSQSLEAADNFNSFNEELQKTEPKQSVLRTLWGGVTGALPSILQMTDVIDKISRLFAG